MATNRGEAATNRKPVASIFSVRVADGDPEQAQTVSSAGTSTTEIEVARDTLERDYARAP